MDNKNNNRTFLSSVQGINKDYVLPTFKEQSNLDFIKYGLDNNFPNELLELYKKSSIHNSIVETKTKMISGDEIIQDIEDEEEHSDKTQNFIEKCNRYGESLHDVFKKVAMDYMIFGLSYLEIIWDRSKKNIAEVYHMDASKVRSGKMNQRGVIDEYYFSRDWINYRKNAYQPIPLNVLDDKYNGNIQILPIVKYFPGLDYYSMPDYVGAIKWIEIDAEICNFHFNNLKNGMNPNLFITLPNGDTTPEERKTIEEKIDAKYTGTDKSGKFMLAFYDVDSMNKPEVTILESSSADKQYDLLNTTTLQQILIGHKVTNQELVGISTPGKLGGKNELLESYDIFMSNIIIPDQDALLRQFNRIMLINGMNNISIVNKKPFEYSLTENILKEILDKNELRELIGYSPLDDDVEDVDEVDVDDEVEELNKMTSDDFEFNLMVQQDVKLAARIIDKNNAGVKIPEANLDDMYAWKTIRSGDNVCPGCLEKSGKVMSLDNWLKVGIPGVVDGTSWSNDGNTVKFVSPHGSGTYPNYCRDKCKCKLIKIGKTKK